MGTANKHSYTPYTLLGTQKEREGTHTQQQHVPPQTAHARKTTAGRPQQKNLATQGLPIGVHSSTLLLQRESYYRCCCIDQHIQQTDAGCSYVLAASNRLLTKTEPKGSLQALCDHTAHCNSGPVMRARTHSQTMRNPLLPRNLTELEVRLAGQLLLSSP
jgi:hypothetical protein